MISKKLLLTGVTVLMVLLSSCSKEPLTNSNSKSTLENELTYLKATVPIESYALDWENVDEVPSPDGDIRLPWQAASSVGINNNILHDYSSEDGWELIYSTFDENSTADHLFFTLYNKYRGVIRTYFYTDPTSEISSSYVTSTINLLGSQSFNSPILNFADQTVIDVNSYSSSASMVQPFQFSRATWYAFEYELAYDENIDLLSFSELSQQWKLGSVNISSVDLNGSSKGEINGTIKSDNKDFSSNGNVSSGDSSNMSSNFSGDENQDKGSNIWKDLGGAVKDGILGAIKGGVQGAATNLLSGIFGGQTETTTEYVKLDIKTDIAMSGTIESSHGAGGPNIPFPGYGASSSGVAYDEAPGVFYLQNRPEIDHVKRFRTLIHSNNPGGPGGPGGFDGGIGGGIGFGNIEEIHTNNYSIDENSINVIWNPDLLAIADIEDFNTEIVSIYPEIEGTNIRVSGKEEQIGDFEALTGQHLYTGSNSTLVNSGEIASVPDDLEIVGVRISFKVVPKNGDSPVFIVKTFKSDIDFSYTQETENI